MATWALCAVTTAPIIGGNTIPPEIAATKKDPPLLVCLPSPLRPNVKIVAKQHDSKTNTIITNPIDVVPVVVLAATLKTKHIPR